MQVLYTCLFTFYAAHKNVITICNLYLCNSEIFVIPKYYV